MASLVPAFEIGLWNGWIFMASLLLLTLIPALSGKKEFLKRLGDSDASLSGAEKKASRAGNILFYVSLIYSIFLPLELGAAWFYAGLAIFLIGIIIVVKASLDFAQAPADRPATGGIYSVSRNPMYLGMMLVYVATAAACASWVFLILTAASIALLRLSVMSEERFLMGKYGQAYRDYLARAPRWIGLPKKKEK